MNKLSKCRQKILGMVLVLILLSMSVSAEEQWDKFEPFSMSGLLPFPYEMVPEQLEFVKEEGTLILEEGEYYQQKTVYTFYNSGNEYTGTIGICIGNYYFVSINFNEELQQLLDVRFLVNGETALYTPVVNTSDALTEDEFFHFIYRGDIYRALIEVTFPAHTNTEITVMYKNKYGGPSEWRDELCYSTTNNVDFVWKGNPKFSLILEHNTDRHWITDVSFQERFANYNTSLKKQIAERSSLENDYFSIQKIDSNRWQITGFDNFSEACYHKLNLELFKRDEGDGTYNYYDFVNRKLLPYEFYLFTNNQLRILRNAIYAQYGYPFKDEQIKNFFKLRPGYTMESGGTVREINYVENPNFNESMLTDIDRANIETIQKLEQMVQ